MEVVTSIEQVEANLRVFDSYSASPDTSAWFAKRLRLGNKFVVGRIGDRYVFAPSRVAGYADCTMERHALFAGKDGRITNRALTKIFGRPLFDASFEAAYLEACRAVGVAPADRHRRAYWPVEGELGHDPVARYSKGDFPGEMRDFVEGATTRVVVNAYERDSAAREACLAHYGHDCAVCGFNFASTYGDVGNGFIHVHHLTPISKRKGSHQIDPIAELRPVCPNCHAMLHRTDPPLTVSELAHLLAGRDDASSGRV